MSDYVCKCGAVVTKLRRAVEAGKIKSCGCLKRMIKVDASPDRMRKNAANRRHKARLRGEDCAYISRPYTGKEVLAIADLYSRGILNRDGQILKLAKQLGRTFQSVADKAFALGLTGPRTASRSHSDSTCLASSRYRERERIEGRGSCMSFTGRGLGGRREDLGGKYFRSAWEANYARFLDWRKIKWEYEVKTFRFDGITRGTMSYTPDFWLPDISEYHEVKGWMDQRSQTQLTRMAKYFPDVRVIVIDKPWFIAARRNGLAAVVPNWETLSL